MRFNGGCSCGCNGFCGGDVLCTLQQGDTVTIHLVYKDDETPILIGGNEKILISFWDYKGDLIHQATIGETDESSYVYKIEHEVSANMVGIVNVELTLIDNDYTPLAVYHGDKVVSINFEPRRNNDTRILH